MSLMIEFDEEMLESIIAQYLRDGLNRIEGYPDDCFDGMDEKLSLKAALIRVHNWVSLPSEWL